MRWSLLLFIISIFQVQAITGFSQKSEFSLNFENASVATILSEIEDESNFYFMCNRKLINLDRIISIRVDNQPIEKILAEIFKGTDVEYIIKGRQIVLTAGKYNLPASEGSQQTRTVSGKVTDSAGNPLPGVSILIKGTAKGVITDAEGSYTIGNLTEKSILDFSFIGMQSQSIPVGNRTTINVNLSEATIGLDEVVAIGYGTTTKSRLISSMSTVKTDDFVDQPYTNLQSALAGRVSGVMVNAAGGQPGSVPSISVRGGEPLIGKTAPLYVIDGLIRSQDAFVALNPNDISEISFLKDALATAVYGAQASAGIVLVTTKQGIVGKPQITYSNNIAWNTPNLFPKLIDSYQKALVSNAISAASGNGNYSVYTKEQLEIIKNGTDLENYPNNNWYDLTFKKYALQQSHNLSITGGTNQIKYYVGLGYFNQGSNYVNDAETYQRFSYRTNITSTFEKIGLDVSFGLNGYYIDHNAPPYSAWSIFSHVVAKSPLEKAYNSDGTLAGLVDSPLAEIYSPGYNRSFSIFNDGTLTFAWNVPWIKGLKLTAIGDFSVENSPSKTFTCLAPQYNSDGTLYKTPNPTLSESTSISKAYNAEFHLDYSKSFGKHNFSANLVSSTRGGNNTWFSVYRGDYPSTAVDEVFAGSASTQTNDGSSSEWGNVGYVGRLKYDYDAKYLIEFNGRYDGSDYFPKSKRYGFFPSVGLGWTISKEPFYQNSQLPEILSYLKLRGSIGTTGSIGGTKYAYIPQYNVNTQVFVANGSLKNGYSEGALTIADQNITWYSTNSYDWGFDFTTLKEHLSGSFDYYYTRSKNILGNPSYSYIEPLGKSLPLVLTNQATRKEGVDGNVVYKNKINENLSYAVGANFTLYDYLWEVSSEDSVALTNPYTRSQGVSQTYYGTMYNTNGLYQDYDDIINNPMRLSSTNLSTGDVWLTDANGDGKIDAQDFRRQGRSSTPRFMYGFTLNLKYKRISIDALLQGTGKRNVYLGSYIQGGEGSTRINFDFQTDYWASSNADASFPRAGNSSMNGGNNYTSNNFWLVDAQYLRLKSLSITYDLKGERLLRNLSFFREFSVYASGTNLLTFSPCKKYFDPELADSNNFFYPVNKTYSFGVRIGF